MASVEVFLDQMPGETRGIIARGGHYHHLTIHRDSDRACDRLGAVLVGRVVRVEPVLRGAFVDCGMGEPYGFLPFSQKDQLTEGAKIEVEVVAEPRETKGPAYRLLGPSEGEPRLVRAGPSVADLLARLAPKVRVQEGLAAVRAALEAEEDALSVEFKEASTGLDLAVERTRALISIDIDHRPASGRDGRKAREAVNWAGLNHAARILRLKSWGGLVVVDLVGTNLHGETVTKAAKTAFAHTTGAVCGPLSRFGLLQLSLPWGAQPIDDRLGVRAGQACLETRALKLVRLLRQEMLTDSHIARLMIHAGPEEARLAAPYIEALGPRAAIAIDPALLPGQSYIKEA